MNIKNLFNKPEKIIKSKKLPQTVQDRFISEMAQNPHKKDAVSSWIKNIYNNGPKNVELEKVLTWLSPKLLKQINTGKTVINSPIVVMSDKQVGHSGKNKAVKQALSEKEYLDIYNIVNNPDEIYEDFTNKKWKQIAFIKVLKDGNCIKVCVRFNQKSRIKDKGNLINRVTTVGKVNYKECFTDKNLYKKIE